MNESGAHTLVESEARWRRPTLAALAIGAVAVTACLAYAYTFGQLGWPAWLACAAASCAPVASNLGYLASHRGVPTVGMLPVSVLALVPATLAVALCAPSHTPVQLVCMGVFLCSALASAWLACWFARLRAAYAHAPKVTDAAAVIVLGAAVHGGVPTKTLASRLDAALALWRAHPATTLVVTGGPTPDATVTEAEVMASYLVRRGVPPASIIVEPRARNTEQNIAYATALLDARGFSGQRCVLSNDYHLYRALRIARGLGRILDPVPVRTQPASRLQQWCREVLTLASSGQ